MLHVGFIAVALIAQLLGASSFVATPSRRPTPTPAPAATSVHQCPDPRKGDPGANATPPPRDRELHLLTFDLDDTLFPIGPVVADANAAQLRALIQRGHEGAAAEEIVSASRRIRTEVREAGTDITYTDLRKRSVRREIERLTGSRSGGTGDGAAESAAHDSIVDAVFDAWLSERHASADRNLFPHASDALKRIREEHPAAVCGAITNGRGNPLEMASIGDYFDFCVSGEDDGVFPRRKPDKGIYEAAVRKYEELRGGKTNQPTDDAGFNWIHVGDDLANDVGASAACGAKPIWVTAEGDRDELPSWSTATGEELARRAALDEAAREYVSAQIVSLEELPATIVEVLRSC